jgi:adenosylcobyric acid synthase
MSNNARVVDGGEIGVAQYIQALAARAAPDVRMNPVLLKPQSSGSQVILMGGPDYAQTHLPWRMRKPLCWPSVIGAIDDLRGDYDLVIAEGAGSSMEPYLRDNDITNMRVALETDADVLVTTDTARGGAFAHLYGLWTMMNEREKARIKGFILNLFYPTGTPEMLTPAIRELEGLTGGIPVLGIIPEIRHCLPEEDRYSLRTASGDKEHVVAIVAYPMMSNFDEFAALGSLKGVSIRWVQTASELAGAHLIILPGSKHVAADLAWMRAQGIDAAIAAAARAGQRILGVCGGLQMLGHRIDDPEGIEGEADGLGLLDIRTTFSREKVQRSVTARLDPIDGVWAKLSGMDVTGYEIRNGHSAVVAGDNGVRAIQPDGCGFVQGNLLGLYLHGLFENAAILEALFAESARFHDELDAAFETMADTLDQYLDMGLIERMVTA